MSCISPVVSSSGKELLKGAGKLAAPGMDSNLAEKIGDQPRRFGGAGDQKKVPVIH
jgi:hypothetical protein